MSLQISPGGDGNVLAKEFKLLEKLGEGSYGSVYKALHIKTGTIVAIKIIPIDSELEDIVKEINFMKQLESPFIVNYHGWFFKFDENEREDLWIVIEYCGGGSVSDVMLARRKTLTERQIAPIMRQATLKNLLQLDQHIKQMTAGLGAKRSEVPILEREQERRRAAVNGLAQLDKWNAELKEMRAQLAWARVEEAEEKLKREKRAADAAEESRVEAQGKAAEHARAIEAVQKEKAGVMAEVERLTRQYEQSCADVAVTRRKIDEVKREQQGARSQMARTKADKGRTGQRLKRLSAEIERIKEEREAAKGGEADRARQIAAGERECADREAELDALTEQVNAVRSDAARIRLEQAQAGSHRARAALKEADKAHGEVSRQYNGARRQAADGGPQALERFQWGAAKLQGKIEANMRRFSRPPIGPIGSCLRIEDPRWVLCIEQMMGPLSSFYLCANQQDADLLHQLAKSERIDRLTVQTIPFGRPRYSIPARECAPVPRQGQGYVRMIDALTFTCDEAFNAVEDARTISQLILTEDLTLARRVIFNRELGAVVREALVPERTTSVRLFLRGSTKSEVRLKRSRQQFHPDKSVRVEQLRREVEQAQEQVDLRRQDSRAADRQLEEARGKIIDEDRKAKQLERQQRALQNQVDGLQLEISKLRDQDSDDAAADDAAQQIEANERQIGEEEKVLNALGERMEKFKEASDMLDTRLRELQDEMAKKDDPSQGREVERIHGQVPELDNKIGHHQQRFQVYSKTQEKSARDKAVHEERAAELREAVEEAVRGAVKLAPERVEVGATSERLEQDIHHLGNSIRTQEGQQGGSADELRARLEAAQTKLRDMLALIVRNEELAGSLGEAARLRGDEYSTAVVHTYHALASQFNENLGLFKFAGMLESDHVDGLLSMRISKRSMETGVPMGRGEAVGESGEMGEGAERAAAGDVGGDGDYEPATGSAQSFEIQDVKSLSGGERGVTMVSLVLSLWDVIGAPLCCWDEYEMMMDGINRDQSTRAMLGWMKSRSSLGRQLILVSPRSTQVVEDPGAAEWITTFRLQKYDD